MDTWNHHGILSYSVDMEVMEMKVYRNEKEAIDHENITCRYSNIFSSIAEAEKCFTDHMNVVLYWDHGQVRAYGIIPRKKVPNE
jgi:uncharacterized protein YutD